MKAWILQEALKDIEYLTFDKLKHIEHLTFDKLKHIEHEYHSMSPISLPI